MRRLRYILLMMLVAFSAKGQTGSDRTLDSLIVLYHNLDDSDTNKTYVCREIALTHFNVDSVIMWAQRLLDLSKIHKSKFHESKAYHYFAWAHFYKSNYNTSIDYCYQGIRINDDLESRKAMWSHYYILACNYLEICDYYQAEENIDKAISLCFEFGDTTSAVKCMREQASMYYNTRSFDECFRVFGEAIHLDSLANLNKELRLHLLRMADHMVGYYNEEMGDCEFSRIWEAKRNCNVALSLPCLDLYDVSYGYYVMNKIMFQEIMRFNYTGTRRQDIIDSMRNFCDEELDVAIKYNGGNVWFYHTISSIQCNIAERKFAQAQRILDSLENSNCKIEYLPILYLTYRDLLIQKGDFAKALTYSEKYSRNLLHNYSPNDIVTRIKIRDRKNFEKERLVQENKREMYIKSLTMMSVFVIFFVVLIALFLLYRYLRKRKHYKELDEKNVEISHQKEEIQHQRDALENRNKLITNSINYASNIQSASLPDYDFLTELFGEFLLIYRPLNIVSGDFYWANRVGKYNVLACGDCTGHGVPGAFVSMLGISLLNEVAYNTSGEIKASYILDTVRSKLMKALGQDKQLYAAGKRVNMDGMDLAMVMIDYSNMKLQYAGAYRPLWIWRDGKIIEYKPDKMPIGIYLGADRFFTNHVIDLQPGDMIYMFSDGITDQFGYLDDSQKEFTHFSAKRLEELLNKIGGLDAQVQKDEIETVFGNWINGYRQIDDIILIGIRI